MTADMGAQHFHRSHFHMEIIRSIHLQAIAKRMDVSSMHNTITPVADQSLM